MSIAQQQLLTPRSLFQLPIVPFIRAADRSTQILWNIPQRRLLDYFLLFIEDGTCTISVNDTTYHCHAGDFYLIQPNDLVSLSSSSNTISSFAHFDLFYSSDRDQRFPTRPGQIDISPFQHLLQPRLNDCLGIHIPAKFSPLDPASFRDSFATMITQWQRQDIVSLLEAQYTATQLLLELLKSQQHLLSEKFSEPQSLNWIASYLSLHLSEPITVSDMAAYAQLSDSRFSALFRQRFGIPPHQYLLRLRTEHAEDLLVHTSLPLRLIAEYCGFADVQHFTKAFKKNTGRTPKLLRKKPPSSTPL